MKLAGRVRGGKRGKRPSLNVRAARAHATLVVASVLLVLLFVWYAADLLMLVFAGVLVSILLRGFSGRLHHKTDLGRGLSLAIVSLALGVLIIVVVWLVTGRIGTQVTELRQQLPVAVENVKNYFGQYEWARNAIEGLPKLNDGSPGAARNIVSQLTVMASTTLGMRQLLSASRRSYSLAADLYREYQTPVAFSIRSARRKS